MKKTKYIVIIIAILLVIIGVGLGIVLGVKKKSLTTNGGETIHTTDVSNDTENGTPSMEETLETTDEKSSEDHTTTEVDIESSEEQTMETVTEKETEKETQKETEKEEGKMLSTVNFQMVGDELFFSFIEDGKEADFEKITVIVYCLGHREDFEITENFTQWKYEVKKPNSKYYFTFTPYDKNGTKGDDNVVTFLHASEIVDLSIPRVEISTLNGVFPTCDYVSPPEGYIGKSITNNEYVQSIIKIYDKDNNLTYISSDNSYEKAKIKVRGNTSAYKDKKPYKIKLDKKADLLSGLVDRDENVDYRDKNWILLRTGENLKHAVGNTVSAVVGMDYVPAYDYVALFINGDYRGLYILTESVKDSETRCDISDSGYIVEYDAYWWNEDLYFSTYLSKNSTMKYTFKFPEDITEKTPQYIYIRDYISKFEKALANKEDVSKYIDIESCAKWLLVHDIIGTEDSGGSNIYIAKYDNTDNSKLVMGPTWDFDTICRTQNEFSKIRTSHGFWMSRFTSYNEFNTIYKQHFDRVCDNVLVEVNNTLNKYNTEDFNKALKYESARWSVASMYTHKYISEYNTWFEEHLNWMKSSVK